MAAAAALAAVVACHGTRGSLAKAHAEVTSDYCRQKDCSRQRPAVVYLGDGCYVADGEARRLYECTIDVRPAGERWCMEDWAATCAGTCRSDIYIHEYDGTWPGPERRVGPTGRCRSKLWAYVASKSPPPVCQPARVETVDLLAKEGPEGENETTYVPLARLRLRDLPSEIDLPRELIVRLVREGRSKAVVAMELCSDESGKVTPRRYVKSSGHLRLDRLLRRQLDSVHAGADIPTSSCALAGFVVSGFSCSNL